MSRWCSDEEGGEEGEQDSGCHALLPLAVSRVKDIFRNCHEKKENDQ